VATIERRGPHRYRVRFRTLTGEQRSRTFQREIDARRFRAEVESAHHRGELVDPRRGRVTVRRYAETWLAGKPTLRPRTRDEYRSVLDKHILPTFGDLPINRVTTSAVRTWHARVQTNAGAARAAKAYRVLRAMLNTAVDDGLLARNPCRVKGAGEETPAERPFISGDDLRTLLEKMPEQLRASVVLAAVAGLRLGELLALRRRDIDLERLTVTISEQCQERADGTVFFAPPKTAAGVRQVAIPGSVADLLRAHLEAFTGLRDDDLVFAGRTGQPLRRRAFYKAWRAARDDAGLTGIRPHDLRHYGATIAAQAGATTRELMARLGHASPRAALIYQHAAADRDREIAERVGELVGRVSPVCPEPPRTRVRRPSRGA